MNKWVFAHVYQSGEYVVLLINLAPYQYSEHSLWLPRSITPSTPQTYLLHSGDFPSKIDIVCIINCVPYRHIRQILNFDAFLIHFWYFRCHRTDIPSGDRAASRKISMCLGGILSHTVSKSANKIRKTPASPSISANSFCLCDRATLFRQARRQDAYRNIDTRYVAIREFFSMAQLIYGRLYVRLTATKNLTQKHHIFVNRNLVKKFRILMETST